MIGRSFRLHTYVLLSLTSALLLACSQAPAAPPKTAEPAPSKPAAAAPPVAPAAPAVQAPVGSGNAALDELIEAARKEPILTIATGVGTGPQKVVAKFKEKYPFIEVQHSGFRASDLGPRVITEQRNGIYAWDIQVGTGFNTVGSVLAPAEAVGDISEMLKSVPSDVKDNTKWAGGFEKYRDPAVKDSLITSFNVAGGFWVNRDVIKTSDLSTFDQLIDPKFKGKIAIYNPTQTTGGSQDLAPMLANRGEAFLRSLLDDQKMVVVDAKRQATEWMVTGRYPIGLGMDEEVIEEFQAQGIGKNVEEVREPQSAYLRASGVTALKNPPHPNTAKLFLHWFLSQEGQDAFASLNSPFATTRRLDVTAHHPKDTPDFSRLNDYQVWTGTPAGDVWLQKVVDIVNKK
ncbi:MAG: extracellular solute-binding protein [Chloroflexota bacterium]